MAPWLVRAEELVRRSAGIRHVSGHIKKGASPEGKRR